MITNHLQPLENGQQGSPTDVCFQLASGQLVAGTTVQQVAGQPATLVKAGTAGGAGTLPSVTIPVTAVSLGITVNVPQQHKTLASEFTAFGFYWGSV